MKRQRNQLIIMLLLLGLLLGAYWILQHNNKQQETEESQEQTQLLTERMGIGTDSGQIEGLSYYYEEQLCELVKEEDVWKVNDNKEENLKQTTINTMVSGVFGTNIVSQLENVEDLSIYGLSEPSNIITLKGKGEEHIIKIGSKNELTSYLYVMLDEDTTVYVVSNAMGTCFNYGMEDLIDDSLDEEIAEETAEAVEEGLE